MLLWQRKQKWEAHGTSHPGDVFFLLLNFLDFVSCCKKNPITIRIEFLLPYACITNTLRGLRFCVFFPSFIHNGDSLSYKEGWAGRHSIEHGSTKVGDTTFSLFLKCF